MRISTAARWLAGGTGARRCAVREARASAQRTRGGRACADALQRGQAGEKGVAHNTSDCGNEPGYSSAITRTPAHCYCENSCWQEPPTESRRPGPGPRNWQDPAGDCSCMQGGSPEPCRRRPCPAQAGWPYRGARRAALQQTVDGDRATSRALTRVSQCQGGGVGHGLRWRSGKVESSPPASCSVSKTATSSISAVAARTALHAPRPTPMITLTNDEVGYRGTRRDAAPPPARRFDPRTAHAETNRAALDLIAV